MDIRGYKFEISAPIFYVTSPLYQKYQIELSMHTNRIYIFKVLSLAMGTYNWDSYIFLSWFDGAQELLAGDQERIDKVLSCIKEDESEVDT